MHSPLAHTFFNKYQLEAANISLNLIFAYDHFYSQIVHKLIFLGRHIFYHQLQLFQPQDIISAQNISINIFQAHIISCYKKEGFFLQAAIIGTLSRNIPQNPADLRLFSPGLMKIQLDNV